MAVTYDLTCDKAPQSLQPVQPQWILTAMNRLDFRTKIKLNQGIFSKQGPMMSRRSDSSVG